MVGGVIGTYSLVFDCGAVGAYNEFLGGGGEIGQAADGEVFVVEIGIIVDGVVGLLHNRENPGLCVVVAVGTNTEIDLLIRGVLAIGLHQTKQRIFGRSSHSGCGEH